MSLIFEVTVTEGGIFSNLENIKFVGIDINLNVYLVEKKPIENEERRVGVRIDSTGRIFQFDTGGNVAAVDPNLRTLLYNRKTGAGISVFESVPGNRPTKPGKFTNSKPLKIILGSDGGVLKRYATVKRGRQNYFISDNVNTTYDLDTLRPVFNAIKAKKEAEEFMGEINELPVSKMTIPMSYDYFQRIIYNGKEILVLNAKFDILSWLVNDGVVYLFVKEYADMNIYYVMSISPGEELKIINKFIGNSLHKTKMFAAGGDIYLLLSDLAADLDVPGTPIRVHLGKGRGVPKVFSVIQIGSFETKRRAARAIMRSYTDYQYRPGGPGYEAARHHFNEMAEFQKRGQIERGQYL